MRSLGWAALMTTCLAVVTSAAGQPPAGDQQPMARLLGHWSGSGTILGQPSTIELQWTRVLEGRFVRLTHVSRIGAAPKTTTFEGHAYYDVQPAGGYRATWFDSTGQTRAITASGTGAALVAAWSSPTEEGDTTYTLLADGQMEVVDRVKGRNGMWREFGRTRLSRTLPPG